MKRIVSAVFMVALVAGSLLALAPAAQADGGRIAAGVAGGLIGGALLGSALASRPAYAVPPPPPVYYAPAPAYAPAPVYMDEPECRLIRQQYWDGYGYRIRRVQVCD